jgi:putative peptidoglycan lipid II flippase
VSDQPQAVTSDPDVDDDETASRHSALVTAGIGLSRLSGLARTAVIARFFGVSPVADAFQAAMRIPNLLQNLLGEGVLSASFIPVYSRLLAQGRDEEAGRVAGAIAGLLALLTGLLAVGGIALAEPITRAVAVGFTGERLDLTVTLTRILFPGIGFLVLSAWCLGVLNSHRRFFLSYVAPVIWNMTQIVVLVTAAVLLLDGGLSSTEASSEELEQLAIALAWGVFAGGVLQFAVQVPAVLRSATSLFGMSAAASQLPALSTLDGTQASAVTGRLRPTLARIAFYVVPTVVGFVVVGELAYDLVLPSLAATQVWLVLLGSSIGLLANTSSRLLQSALYAGGDTRTPTRYAIIRVVLAALVGAVLMLQFDRLAITPDAITLEGSLPAFTPLPVDARATDQTAFLRLGAVGLALAAGASAWLEFALLRRHLARRMGIVIRMGGGMLPRTLLAGGGAAVVGVTVRVALDGQPSAVTFLAAGTAIVATYLAGAAALRLPETDRLARALRR